MLRACEIRPTGTWSEVASDTITLTRDQRYRRRFAMRSDGGIDFLLDLPETTVLRQGDALLLDDGRMVEVKAEPEELLEVRADDSLHLLRLAWHLGNRHLEAQVEASRILIRRDAVIAAMLAGLGAHLAEVVELFNPEGGAYAHGARHHRPHEHHDDHG